MVQKKNAMKADVNIKMYQKTCSLLLLDLCLILFSLISFSNISEMRKAYKDAFLKKHNMKLGFMSAFVKAAAYALVDQPAVNAGKDFNFKRLRNLTLWYQADCLFARFVSSQCKCVW